jgi:hypothetical protein
MYFSQEWDALKSVKYILAARINHAPALRSRGGARAHQNFPFFISKLAPLTSWQGAFS